MADSYDDTTAFLQATVNAALNSANNNTARIYSLPPQVALREPDFKYSVTDPNLDPPPKFSDLFDVSESVDTNFDWLDEKFDAWMSKYFPELNGCLKTQPEEIMCGIFSGVKPFGVDKTVFEMVWHQARDRAYRTVSSEQATIAAEFSSRGFSLPVGTMVDMMTKAEDKGTVSILDVNRDQAMKDADIKVDLLKTAMELAVRLKLGVMQAAADFYRMWITLPDKDIEKARIKAQAMSAFYSALSAYYNVELGFQELKLKAEQTDASVDIDVDRNRLTHESHFGATASALGQATSAFANVAAQASVAGGSLSAKIESL